MATEFHDTSGVNRRDRTRMTEPSGVSLAAISHGTSSPDGQRCVEGLVEEVRGVLRQEPGLVSVKLGHVDVQEPDIIGTVEEIAEDVAVVMVPLLLSAGYHVNVDMRRDVEKVKHRVEIAEALGPDDLLVEILLRRVLETGSDPSQSTVVLVGAGSSDSEAVAAVKETAVRLSSRLGSVVVPAFLSFAQPSVEEAIETAQGSGKDGSGGEQSVIVVSYLLAPGYFQDSLKRKAALHTSGLITDPLLRMVDDSPQIPQELVSLVVQRFENACEALAKSGQVSELPD